MKFASHILQEIVRENYGFECNVKRLGGDVDFNFLIKESNGAKYLLKICEPEVSQQQIQFQIEILNYLNDKDVSFDIPEVIPNNNGDASFIYQMDNAAYAVRLHTWVEGRMLSDINPRTPELYNSWGKLCGMLSSNLQGFDHLGAHRFDKWNPIESMYSKKYMEYFVGPDHIEMAEYFWGLFEKDIVPSIPNFRKSVNYSDAHEHNILVSDDYLNPEITGVIDFGDAIYAPTICELAIACAYAGMYVPDPISAMVEVVSGYHSEFAILEEELEVLFAMICGRLMITVASAAHNLHLDPENEYHQISTKPAWDLLKKLKLISPRLAQYRFRSACGLAPHPKFDLFHKWMVENEKKTVSPIPMDGKKVRDLDLSVGSLELGNNSNFETVPRFGQKVDEILHYKEADIGIGGYGEIRPFYTTDAYKVEGNSGPQWRTMHLGMDFWTEVETEVLAICDGEVQAIKNNDNPCDYGPTIIVKHEVDDGLVFFTLYGHLSMRSLSYLSVGQKVKKGDVIAWIGDDDVNGGWPSHLHFQVMLDLLGNKGDFPGVAYVNESDTWLSICPCLPLFDNNNILHPEKEKSEILSKRKEVLGKSLSVSYQKPLHMVRGFGIYLYDVNARRYIDTINNVAHVGHEHPRVVRAAQRQMELLNTNTRYLHKNILKYAEALLANSPEEMEVVYLVNSGSEANELALRMAKTYTSQKDIIALETGYHGNTGACIDISSYKFDGKGGQGAPEYTSICRMPDTYRGEYKDLGSAGRLYAEDVSNAIVKLKGKGRNVAAFIAESILSCGGQIVLPPEYLKLCYEAIRAEGGLCISDEVQVGFGRVGDHFWGFELQGVVPDIITCGKPIGNGHPLAAVITTRAVAEAFTNGMEYFNTFGGNPVSCAIGYEVLDIIKDEDLKQNAKAVGSILLNGLNELKTKYDLIGDVRGVGLFLGFELVKDENTLEPAAEQATYLVNRMRDYGILMSTDGPLHNVIKIKPPMCIAKDQAEEILMRLDMVLQEDFMRTFHNI